MICLVGVLALLFGVGLWQFYVSVLNAVDQFVSFSWLLIPDSLCFVCMCFLVLVVCCGQIQA